MKSIRSSRFRKNFESLSPEIQKQANEAFRMWKSNPSYPSLHFKAVGTLWSIRVSKGYRALGTRDGDTMTWLWIGPHSEYGHASDRRQHQAQQVYFITHDRFAAMIGHVISYFISKAGEKGPAAPSRLTPWTRYQAAPAGRVASVQVVSSCVLQSVQAVVHGPSGPAVERSIV